MLRNQWGKPVLAFVGALILALMILPAMWSQMPAQQEAAASPGNASPPDLSGLWSRLRDKANTKGYEAYVLDFGKSDSPMTPWAAAIFKKTNAMFHGDDD